MTIDWWTLGIQTINVAVLVWLLQRFFWRPVAAMIEQRRAATRHTLAEASDARAQAATALADIERTRAGFAHERDAILAEARAAAEQERAAVLARAEREASAIAANAAAAAEAARLAAEHAWTERSARLAVTIAEQLAARLDGAAVRAAFLDWLTEALAAVPDAMRAAERESGTPLEIVSAAPLDAAGQDMVRVPIAAAFGDRIAVTFRTDPALIVGLELHGANSRISNSWRADLDRILAVLTAEEPAAGTNPDAAAAVASAAPSVPGHGPASTGPFDAAPSVPGHGPVPSAPPDAALSSPTRHGPAATGPSGTALAAPDHRVRTSDDGSPGAATGAAIATTAASGGDGRFR